MPAPLLVSSVHLLLAAQPEACRAGTTTPLAPLDAALLVWLALEGPTPRNRLAGLLWPDKPLEFARNSLRQRLFKLRRQVGTDLVEGAAVAALAAGVSHDLADADTVLDGVELPIGGEFEQWIELQRNRRRGRVRRSLVELAEMAEAASDWDDALTHAGELLALDPLSEEAHRRVMRLHYLAGDRAAALLAFDRCAQVLKDEVGASPSAETMALLATVSAAAAPAAALPAHAAVPASVLRPPRLVGRARELAALQSAWDAGHVAGLVGEAGLGKTRLLAEFAATRPDIVAAAGRPGDAGVPFATLARLLRAVAAAGPPALPADTRGEIARVLPEFDTGGGTPRGEGQRLVLLRAVQALLAGRPPSCTLVVDDLHFADAASLDLLASLIDDDRLPGPSALRWLLAWRPAEAGSPLHALLDRLTESARLVPIAISPLDEAALAELVDSLSLPGIEGSALARGLLQRTGGNPLFVLETLKQAWVERTLAQLADARQLPRPLSVGRLIERRLAQLTPGALALARVASIAGVDFSVELAEAVLQAGALQFADALNELEAAQVLRGTAFAHDLVFDAVRASVPTAIAQLTHARVAAWLAPRGAEPARIAQHWIDAGREAEALPWLEQAAERAGAALRRLEQLAFLDRKAAIEAAQGDRVAAFETVMHAAEIEVTLDTQAAQDTGRCDRLDALADTVEQRVRAATQRSNREVMRGFLAEAETLAATALRLAQRTGIGETPLAQCRIALATALSAQERTAEALVHFEAALGWVRAQTDETLRCEFHGNLAITYDRNGNFEDGLAQHREAVRLAQRVGEYTNWAVCLSNSASNRTRMGAMAEADALLVQAWQVYAQAAEKSAIGGYLAIEHGMVHRQLGRYAKALQCCEEGLVQLRRYAPGYESVLLSQRAACWAHLGQWARMAGETAEIRAQEVPPRTQVRLTLLEREADVALRRPTRPQPLVAALSTIPPAASPDFRHALETEIATLDGDLATLERVADEARRQGHPMSQLPALARGATVALALGRGEHALGLAHAAWALTDRFVATMFYPLDAWLHCGRVFEAAGDRAAALAVAARARAWIEAALAHEVAAEFRDSFMNRNVVNRELLALAVRLGAG